MALLVPPTARGPSPYGGSGRWERDHIDEGGTPSSGVVVTLSLRQVQHSGQQRHSRGPMLAGESRKTVGAQSAWEACRLTDVSRTSRAGSLDGAGARLVLVVRSSTVGRVADDLFSPG